DRLLCLGLGEACQASPDLSFENFLGLLLFPVGEGLPDAKNWFERGLQSGESFLADDLVGFAEVLPPLGMAHDNVTRGEFLEHSSRDFPGVRAVTMLADVLCAKANIGDENSF